MLKTAIDKAVKIVVTMNHSKHNRGEKERLLLHHVAHNSSLSERSYRSPDLHKLESTNSTCDPVVVAVHPSCRTGSTVRAYAFAVVATLLPLQSPKCEAQIRTSLVVRVTWLQHEIKIFVVRHTPADFDLYVLVAVQ